MIEALILGLVLISVVIAAAGVAGRLGVALPILLVLAGIALSFVPGMPAVRLDPDVILVLVLPPLLYAAAVNTSVPAFRQHRRSIGLLAVGLTLFTTILVGLVAARVIPGLPLAAALALGAIVAPPDAVAATSIARRAGLPRKLVTLLEGESLFNDAVALVAYRVAVGAALSGVAISVSGATLEFVLASAGGLVVGYVVARVLAWVRARVDDDLRDNALALISPFAAYLPAEAIHASGVLAVVVAGIYLGHREPSLMSASSRLVSHSVWRVIEFLLQGLVFVAIGLQLPEVLRGLGGYPAGVVTGATLAVLATVILGRFVWVFPVTYLTRLIPRVRERDPAPPWQYPMVLSWAGLRGVVSMAAAFALPFAVDGTGFPGRDLMLFITFVVILGTLVLQGLTLPWVIRRLRLPRPDPVEDALQEAEAQEAAAAAAIARLEKMIAEEQPPPGVAESLRAAAEYRRLAAWERLGPDRTGVQQFEIPSVANRRLRKGMIEAERDVFVGRRDRGELDEEVFGQLMRRLDLEEAALERGIEESDQADSIRAPRPYRRRPARSCPHVKEARKDVVPNTPEGCTECLRTGDHWVHLRLCLSCGLVACCDSSPNRHANAHFHAEGHPVIRSFEPGEEWRWCYVDEILV
jgi:monovalent cation/hydrogen antiporter